MRTRFILTFLLAAMLPLVLFTAGAYNGGRALFRQHAFQSLSDAAHTATGAMLARLTEHQQGLQTLANESAVNIVLTASTQTIPPEAITEVQSLLSQALLKRQPYIETLCLVDGNGVTRAKAGIVSSQPSDYDHGTVCQALQAGLTITWLEDAHNGKAELYMLVPLGGAEGQPASGGVLAVFNPELLADILRRYLHRTGENGFAFIWDTQQRILAETRERYEPGTPLATAIPDLSRLAPLDEAMADEYFNLVLSDQDIGIIAATDELPTYHWTILYAQPEFTIDAPLVNGLEYLWKLTLALIIVFFVVAIWLSEIVTRPIADLTKIANQVAAGDMSRRVPERGSDEIGQLARSFNTMTSQLEGMFDGLARRNEELSQLNTRLRRIVTTTTRLAGPADLRRLCTIFLEELAVQLGTAGGSLYLAENGQLRLVHTLDPGHAPAVIPYPPRPGSPFAAALEEGRPLLLTDFSAKQTRASGWGGYQANETLVFPLLDKDNDPVALISLHNKKDGRFSAQDREICAVFASFGSERLRLAQARDELAASEIRYRRLVETAQEGIITVDEQETITFTNSSIARLLGYRPSELAGKSLELLVEKEHWEKVRQGTTQRRRGISSVYEVVMQTKDGRMRTMQVAASPLLDKHGGYEGALGVLTDITEYKHTHQELANQSAYMQSVFAALSDMVCVVSPGLRLLHANKRFCEEFNLDQPVSGNVDFERLITPQLAASAQLSPLDLIRETFTGGGRHHGETVLKFPRGERILELDTSPLLDSAELVSGVVQVLRDVTEQQRLESQLRQAHKMEAIGRLASGIAHDFNNLLTAIAGCAEVALGECGPHSPVGQELQEIGQATQRGREIVRQILAFSRRQDQERRPVSLRTVVSEVLSLMRASLPATIEIHQEFNAPHDTVLADAGQLHQVVMNLCTNAVQAMAEHGGRLSARITTIHAGVEQLAKHPQLRPGPHVQLVIGDTGEGIPEEQLSRIFEPFYTTKGGQGTGLGLAVVHSNVLGHGGAVEVDSAVGTGSQFTVLLPLAEEQQAAAAPEPLASHGQERVLFVDDEQMIVRTTQRLLSKLGYQVTALADSREALAVFEQNPQAFDILITDQTMPLLTGCELASAVLRLRPGLPVVLCTGYSESVPPERARQLGIREYVMKPYTGEELGARIRRLLDERGS